MTIGQAISQTRKLSGNAVEDATLCRWLSELDGRLMLDFYKGGEWMSYSLPDDEDHELLVPFPWDELYVHYLEAMVYYSNGEFERYRNSYEMYNKKELDFRQWYARTHVHVTLDMLQKRDCTVVMEPKDQRCSRPFWYLSAYGIAVRHGYQGSVDEWLAELVGPEGPPGQDGRDGQDGAEGPQGRPGAAAGFGQVTATVDDTGGTPAVEVEASGPDTAKNFHFSFTGLKGQQGDQGASFTALEKTAGTGAPGTTDTYTAYNSEGTAAGTIQVYNGADGLGTGDFKADGTVPMTGSLQMGGKQITGMAEPTQDADGATKSYVDNSVKNVSVTTDPAPTQDSDNPVQSGGVYTALAGKADLTLSNLSNYQKALRNIGGRPNSNLLDNAYFKGGGSQQGGGQFPINQRGQTSYTGAVYGIDLWKGLYGSELVALEADCLSLTFSGNQGISQILDADVLQALEGQTITQTILWYLSSGNYANAGLAVNGTPMLTPGIQSVGSQWMITSKTVQMPDSIQSASFTISGDGNIKVKAVKLELGDHQTLAYQDESGAWQLFETPDYGEELAKCQRYQLVLSSTDAYSSVGSGVVHTTTQARIVIPLPNTLRIKPTLSYSGNFQLLTNETGATITKIVLESINQNCISVQATSSGLVVGQAAILRSNNDVNAKIILDANL